MRICFVCNEYPPAPHGGIGTFVQTLARSLGELEQEIIVAGFDARMRRTSFFQESGVKVLRVRCPFPLPSKLPGRWFKAMGMLGERLYLSRVLTSIIRELRVDLVESYDWSGPLWSKPTVPLLVRLHGANTANQAYEGQKTSRLLRFLEGRNVAMADALAAVSNHIGAATLKALGLNGKNFTVIYNGIDCEMFKPQDVAKDKHEVLYVGSLTRRKGIYALFQAIPLVLEKVPEVHFTLVGRLPDGKAGQQLIASLLALLPDSQRASVSFIGYIPHTSLPAVYSRAAVAVFPSHAEAFGLTCLEAMACGTAVVMTSKASGPELVEAGVSGMLADPDSPEELAGRVCTLLKDRALAQELGRNARKRAIGHFDMKKLGQRNLDYYQEVADGCLA